MRTPGYSPPAPGPEPGRLCALADLPSSPSPAPPDRAYDDPSRYVGPPRAGDPRRHSSSDRALTRPAFARDQDCHLNVPESPTGSPGLTEFCRTGAPSGPVVACPFLAPDRASRCMRRAARALELTPMAARPYTSRTASWTPVSDPPALAGRYKIRVGTGPPGCALVRGPPFGLWRGRSIGHLVIPPRTPGARAALLLGPGPPQPGAALVLLQAVRTPPGSSRPARRAARRTSLGCGPHAHQGLTAITSLPAAPATLKCGFTPALTVGFLRAPLSLNQA
jgi:hypothetical protein